MDKILAISLLNRNGLHDTIDCIDSLQQSNFQNFDIFLLDNGSKNNEYKKLHQLYKNQTNIKLQHSPENLWFTGGNNLNLQEIEKWDYQYILLLNNDTIIPHNFLWSFIKQIQSFWKEGIFSPIIKEFYYKNIVQSSGNSLNLRTWGGKRNSKVLETIRSFDYVSWACFLITKKCFEKIWLLDDHFFCYREENDYCFRAKKEGFYSYIIPNTEIFHKEEAANKKVSAYYTYLMFRNRDLFLKKRATKIQYLISWIFLLGYLTILFPKKFWCKQYKYAIKGIVDSYKEKYWGLSF